MPEPLSEQIVAALKTRLGGIVGDAGATYWYTPDRVLRSPAWGAHCLRMLPNVTAPVIYTLSPDDEDNEENTFTTTRASLGIDLVLARRFSPATEDPFDPPDPDRWKIQNRLRDDARKRLRGDLKVSNLALIIQIPLVDLSAEETYVTDWAVVMMRLVVQYTYSDAA